MKKLSPVEQKASSKVLDDLRQHMQGLMKGKMDGLKKVTVASNSPEGLKKGLAKAEDLLKGKDSVDAEEEALETPEEEATEDESAEEESPALESSEEDCKTPEEIDAKIKELLKLKDELLAKK
jgi:hypothetical protein